MSSPGPGYRIVFMLRLTPGGADGFLGAYEAIRWQVAQVPGHVCDQVCQSETDPDEWMITSEWRSAADFEAWESSPGHQRLAAPMMHHVESRRSLRFAVRRETRSGATLPGRDAAR